MKINVMFLATMVAFQMMSFGQQAPEDWFHLDYGKDGYQGVSTEKMYHKLEGKKSHSVIVAVIDSGVDAEHEDLIDVMWVNSDEVPNNGIDDDKNGYIDDIHGWNFIGGKDGKNVDKDQLEVTRLYAKYKKKYENVEEDKLSKKEKKEYKKYQHYKEVVESKKQESGQNLVLYQTVLDAVASLKKAIGKDDFTLEELKKYEPQNAEMERFAAVTASIMEQGLTVAELEKEIGGAVKHFSTQAEYQYNPDYNPRTIVGDNYADSYEKGYGNNDVEGPDAAHGTHVAGIIGATRGNDIGMNGVADNVRIMSIRAVPDGDERDKDIANAIIYAVDNGASVVNMSFGKSYSWDKIAVDKAIKYALKHDVLLVHAAGNSKQNNDKKGNYPNDAFEKPGLFKPKTAKNWLEVGALSHLGGEDAPATFSNYGKDEVDVFSPGVSIYSTTPNNEYARFDGTSMASPVTAGIAAAIRSYYPDLSAVQVKEILMESVVKQNQKVKIPGSSELVAFSELCRTGGTVNAYRAIELAAKTKGAAKKNKRKFTIEGNLPTVEDAANLKKDKA